MLYDCSLMDLGAIACVSHLVNLEIRNKRLDFGLANDTLEVPGEGVRSVTQAQAGAYIFSSIA